MSGGAPGDLDQRRLRPEEALVVGAEEEVQPAAPKFDARNDQAGEEQCDDRGGGGFRGDRDGGFRGDRDGGGYRGDRDRAPRRPRDDVEATVEE